MKFIFPLKTKFFLWVISTEQGLFTKIFSKDVILSVNIQNRIA
jgi:hypothetical protein